MSMYFQPFPWPYELKNVLLFSILFLPFPRSSQEGPVLGTLMKPYWKNNIKKLTGQAEGGCSNLCFRRERPRSSCGRGVGGWGHGDSKYFCGLQPFMTLKNMLLYHVHLMQVFLRMDITNHSFNRIIEDTNTILPLPCSDHLHNLSRLSCSAWGAWKIT